ncbi:MAG: RNA polymerase sigma factor [Bacteroidales bacterium]|nr:RNA polymerase sigma factor [Bacteroidales bacterium]
MNRLEYNNCVKQYSSHLHGFCYNLCKDSESAKDIVQDSFMKLWLYRDKVETSSAKSWLFQCAFREYLNEKRKENYDTNYKNSIEINHQYNTYNGAKEALNYYLQTLPENYKVPIMLKDIEGYSYEEISKITDMTTEQVKINIYRGRVKLKQMIKKKENII